MLVLTALPIRRPNRWVSFVAVLALLVGAVCAVAARSEPVNAAGVPDGAAAYRPNQPCRLLDTRDESGRRIDDHTYRIRVAERCAVGDDLSAVVLTLTVANATGPGHLTVYPAGTQRPDTSNLNYGPARVTANTAVVAVRNGEVDLYVHTPTDVIVDVEGSFAPVDGSVRSGRLVPVAPTRIADTRRPNSHVGADVIDRGAGDLILPLPSGVPADATGVAISVISVDSDPGHVTVHPAGTARPEASVLNTDAYNRTRATTVIAPVSDDGIVLHRHSVGDLVVDLWGWFTGPSATRSTDGLFVPETPTRVWDSRRTADPLHAGGRLTKHVAGAEAAVAALNITALGAVGPGHITAGPAGQSRPTTSTINYEWIEATASATLVRNTAAGVTFWAHSGSHVVVDRFGWFTGGAATATAAPNANPMPSSGGNVLFISDSTFAGIRWSGSIDLLQGATFDARLESCRRLTGASCHGREGYRPQTVIGELATIAPDTVDVLVIGTGYDDYASQFQPGFEAVMLEARRLGIPRVVWLTYREDVSYHAFAPVYRADNAILRQELRSGRWPELILLDWNAHTAAHPEWLTGDGIHFTVAGAREAAMFVSRALANYDRRACPAVIGGVTAPGGWCADPT